MPRSSGLLDVWHWTKPSKGPLNESQCLELEIACKQAIVPQAFPKPMTWLQAKAS